MDELYIPGDLVFHYIPKTTIKKYVKVYVCSTNNVLSLEDMDGNLYDYIGVLYPIPLTPEILEKNGWDFIGYKMDFSGSMFNIYSKHDILPDLYYYYATKNFLVSICGKIVLSNMKYIHELQHLLFGLGLNSEMEVCHVEVV